MQRHFPSAAGRGQDQAGISLCLYRVLRQLLERNYALLCALIYFNMVPKIIQIPDFSNMQLWFFTVTVLCLIQYYLQKDRKNTYRSWLVFMAGMGMALEVLAYPSCVICLRRASTWFWCCL